MALKRNVYLVTIGYESTGENDVYVYGSLARAKRKMREKLRYFEGRPDFDNKTVYDSEMFFRVEFNNGDCNDSVYGRIEKKELL